jgi:hypothetical protein
MSLLHIIIYSVVQGLAELLPVSSSAHVIAAAKLMGRLDPGSPKDDPTSPQFVLLLVMLHTGTMFAVILYFWRAWRQTFFHSQKEFIRFATKITIATGITGGLGYGLLKVIEKALDPGYTRFISWQLTTDNPKHDKVTDETLLTRIVASEQPGEKLFSVGDTVSFTGKRGSFPNSETLAYTDLQVKKDTRLKDLLKKLREGLEINETTAPGKTQPGVILGQDPSQPDEFSRIVITSNLGSENHLKFAEGGLVDQAGLVRLGFFDIAKGEVEQLFKRLDLIAGALAAAGVMIFITGIAKSGARSGTRKGITTGDGNLDRHHSGAQSPLPRVFPLRRHHFPRIIARNHQETRRGIQLCPGSRAHPGGSALRSLPADGTPQAKNPRPYRFARLHARHQGNGIQLPCRAHRSQAPLETVGIRTMVALWRLLPGSVRRHVVDAYARNLKS